LVGKGWTSPKLTASGPQGGRRGDNGDLSLQHQGRQQSFSAFPFDGDNPPDPMTSIPATDRRR
jgi:hypothetical protein